MNQSGQQIWFKITVLLSLVVYLMVAYVIERHQSILLLLSFLILFGIYGFWIKNLSSLPFQFFLITAIVLRLSFLFSIPTLTDDFYRFIWDGRMWVNGLNPFSATPRQILETSGDEHFKSLYPLIYGKDFHTVYPPVSQFIFWFAVRFSDSLIGAIIILRLVVYAFEVGTLFFLMRLTREVGIPKEHMLIYALNPLIILEFSGNLHHETYVVFFLTLILFGLIRKKHLLVSLSFAGAVLSKLLPLIFLPSLIRILSRRNFLAFFISSIGIIALGFWMMLDLQASNGLISGLSLYFKNFEFNPSVWYVIRYIGFHLEGYNIIGYAGPVLWIIAGALILYFSFRSSAQLSRKNEIHKIVWHWSLLLFIFLLFSTTIHPWYITPLILFSSLGTVRFPLWWSFLICLTYLGYSQNGYVEMPWILAVEYITVLIIFVLEWRSQKFNRN